MKWRYFHKRIAAELSAFCRYYDRTVFVKSPNDDSLVYENLNSPRKERSEEVSIETGNVDDRAAIVLNGNLNFDFDIQDSLIQLKGKLGPNDRVVLVLYNSYWRFLYKAANSVGIRKAPLPTTFLTKSALDNLSKLSGFEITRTRPCAYCPVSLLGLGSLINWLFPIFPFIRNLSIVYIALLRPVDKREGRKPSLSILIPARNEKGNIENAIKRMPDFGEAEIEIIFVEGHSTDGTWEEIERVKEKYKNEYNILSFQQEGKGKADAVRKGFPQATKELLTILDADLTMPPELLPRFYEAYVEGKGDFINGSRLVYPMEGEAMRPLNHLGNIFFAKFLSYVLDSQLSDSLCGTKLMTKRDYERFTQWRKDFGDFDPFGDFELLFPASILGLGIVDVPVRYRARTYGQTNISRFRHGFMLLKMTLTGLTRIKVGQL